MTPSCVSKRYLVRWGVSHTGNYPIGLYIHTIKAPSNFMNSQVNHYCPSIWSILRRHYNVSLYLPLSKLLYIPFQWHLCRPFNCHRHFLSTFSPILSLYSLLPFFFSFRDVSPLKGYSPSLLSPSLSPFLTPLSSTLFPSPLQAPRVGERPCLFLPWLRTHPLSSPIILPPS